MENCLVCGTKMRFGFSSLFISCEKIGFLTRLFPAGIVFERGVHPEKGYYGICLDVHGAPLSSTLMRFK
jgi:hypothetical protein